MSLPKIRLTNERELAHYVFRTTALCVLIAFAVDVANQLIFFESWLAAVRSWIITVIVVVVIATPVSRTIGKSHLALYRASTIDALTGLLNRGAFLEGADDSAALIALIIVDIDNFKHVNDRHGHWAGDQVLSAIAHMMLKSLGEFGRVGRLGGEEFAVLASRENRVALVQALEVFRQKVAETPILTKTAAVSVTISAGIAAHDGNTSFEHLFSRADQALYAAKALGRNRIVCADDCGPILGAVSEDSTHSTERRSPGTVSDPQPG